MKQRANMIHSAKKLSNLLKKSLPILALNKNKGPKGKQDKQ